MTSDATEVDLQDLLSRALDTTGQGARWTADADAMWCRLTPSSAVRRQQGWKLHVSATAASAPAVLAKALDVLLPQESVFKFARSLEQVSALNSRATPRGSSGKFITVYPPSDADAARLALELHEATAGLSGPRILSDQPYAANSLVHYRYGAFVGRRRLSDQGLLVWFIEDPDGNPVEDVRTGQYAPPPWVVSPFPPSIPAPPPRAREETPPPVLLGGRFSVREAIRHTNKGGVYRGADATTGAPVVIKEARPHVEADASGADVRDWLRAEARTLEFLDGTDLAPRLLALFEHAGHLFLAQEEIPGVPLRNWVAEHFRDVGDERYRADALDQAARLVELVTAAHAQGCVLRDFTPANIMVRPDGQLRLIDLELAVLKGDDPLPTTVGTPGFSAPERLEGAPVAPTADYYSLGATLCFVLTGRVPQLLPEEPAVRSAHQRLATWLAAADGILGLPGELPEAILGLMEDDPARRWDPARAGGSVARARALRTAATRTAATRTAATRTVEPPPATSRSAEPTSAEPTPATSTSARSADSGPAAARSVPARPDTSEAVVAGIVEHLLDSMTPQDDHRLWPVSTMAGESDPCSVQQGAAGVLAVLARYFELTGDPRLAEPLATAGHWVAARSDTRSVRPGLHFGGSGTAWALYETGRALEDRALTDHALALALAPLEPGPHRDITHGHAGSGLAAAHLWHRTGDPRLAARVADMADRLAAAATREPHGASWPAPAEGVAQEAGKRYLGFAHGTAGIGCFLLAAATVTGRQEHRDLALAAGEALAAQAVTVGGATHWPAQAGDVPTAPYWCHGSAGIGTFLLRLWRATGDDRYGDLARGAARAVMERAPRAPLTQCHGLAGNGDFLLDLARATGEPAHRAGAEAMARLIVAEATHRGSHVVLPNEYGDVSTGWSDGSAGILAFLLRTHHTDSRLWMIQQPG
ncbi:class IV lanthionine synthetase LanL [Streptomyces sp. NPDC059917]|uniref:class IV lanthionine synthetase LanL n=1 Tax=Streptomyces sp. NPDC059917 TaxID=3347002 RepID=UPI003667A93B